MRGLGVQPHHVRDDRALARDAEPLDALGDRGLAGALGVEVVGEILGDVHVDAHAVRVAQLA